MHAGAVRMIMFTRLRHIAATDLEIITSQYSMTRFVDKLRRRKVNGFYLLGVADLFVPSANIKLNHAFLLRRWIVSENRPFPAHLLDLCCWFFILYIFWRILIEDGRFAMKPTGWVECHLSTRIAQQGFGSHTDAFLTKLFSGLKIFSMSQLLE
ncbi:hypothetical protein RRG08_030881 [Elysia crispata]|uniref:Uncharacterized protein n=1 Tax=Elysia crispata TaxID=231223 RepID=A0AAE0XSX2_9GAST|nr:hypothetical protein RRG08_030881 [Elysia crispata]